MPHHVSVSFSLSASDADEATREIHILSLGNSYTARHDIADLVEQILEEGDPTE